MTNKRRQNNQEEDGYSNDNSPTTKKGLARKREMKFDVCSLMSFYRIKKTTGIEI